MNKRKFNAAPEFIRKIDWSMLRGQKAVLIKLADTIRDTKPQPVKFQDSEMVAILIPKETEDVLEGILGLIDAAQDYAVDVLGIPDMHIYDFEQEEERELNVPTGIKAAKGGELKTGDETKQLWLCSNCGSDNIEMKVWRHANYFEPDNNDRDDSTEDDECYCRDCNLVGEAINSELKYAAKVVGFQVVDDEAGDIHPDMDGSFCLYNLSQANKMLHSKHDEGNWKLLTIWSGDVEEPTIMFEGDPRD